MEGHSGPGRDIKTADVDYRSVSQWQTFVRCGEAYRLQKVARAPQRPAAWFAQGTAFHSVVEKWERDGRSATVDTLVSDYSREYDEIIKGEIERVPDYNQWLTGGRTLPRNDIAARRVTGAAQVKAYVEYALSAQEQPWSWFGEPAVEVEFLLDLDGVAVKGFIDIINVWPDGQITPRDYKTGTKKPDWPFQLAVYALAIEQETGYLPRFGDFYLAKNGKPESPVDLKSYTRERVTRWFHDMDRAERQGVYLPNPGDACRICLVPDYCSALGARASEFPTTPEGE